MRGTPLGLARGPERSCWHALVNASNRYTLKCLDVLSNEDLKRLRHASSDLLDHVRDACEPPVSGVLGNALQVFKEVGIHER